MANRAADACALPLILNCETFVAICPSTVNSARSSEKKTAGNFILVSDQFLIRSSCITVVLEKHNLRELYQDFPGVRVIALSQYDEMEYAHRALHAGARGVRDEIAGHG